MSELLPEDLNFIVRTLPKDVRKVLKENPGLCLAGGAIRARIAKEEINDYDLWGGDARMLKLIAESFAAKREVRLMSTDNAHTVLTQGRTPVQFIHRWVFDNPIALADSFDFSIAAAAIWWEGEDYQKRNDEHLELMENSGVATQEAAYGWKSYCSDQFYPDLAAKRLRYLSPTRNEDAGGSFLRMTKFLGKGYTISPESLGKLVARLNQGVRYPEDFLKRPEEYQGRIYTSLLREVDPLLVVDGVESVTEHAENESQEEVRAAFDAKE